MINYIVQIVLFQVLFLAVYDLFLKKETFFKWNRLYLLVTPILSFIIPLLKFESIQKAVPQDYVVLLPEVVLNPQRVIEQTANSTETLNYLNIIFYVGAGFFLALFLVKLSKIIQLIYTSKRIKKENYNLILLESQQSAYSFFNYIFIDKSFIDKEELQIIKHELIHSQQYHTLDLLFFEFLKIVMWFNPMIYSYQNRITLLHEYISDAEVVKETDKDTYFNKLLSETFNVENIAFINQFYKHSLIKKRIIMITKSKSQKLKQLKYLVLIPLLASMLFYTSCSNDIDDTIDIIEKNINNEDVITEGKYFRPEDGRILFLGKNLKGEVVPFEEYTDKEKEFFHRMTEAFKKTGSKMKYQVVINEREERVLFVNTNFSKKDYTNSNSENIPFAYIEKVPSFQELNIGNDEMKKVFSNGITNFVSENFNINVAKNIGLTGKQKIYVNFKILKTGNIEILGARAPHKDLEIEARRVVNSLPKMIPGEHNGKKVNVTYMLPISFEVRE